VVAAPHLHHSPGHVVHQENPVLRVLHGITAVIPGDWFFRSRSVDDSNRLVAPTVKEDDQVFSLMAEYILLGEMMTSCPCLPVSCTFFKGIYSTSFRFSTISHLGHIDTYIQYLRLANIRYKFYFMAENVNRIRFFSVTRKNCK
jgi:hypothetical protein